MLKCILLCGAAIAVPSLAFAQDAETVIVSANRIATPAVEVASSVTLIDADQIEQRQLRTLPDVLRDVPGLSVVQTGGPGGQTSLFMRGTNANHTKVLVDGIDVSDPSSPAGAADVSKFLTGDIARVEVLRGPQSGLYGSDAIGGVVSITTKAGEGAPTISGTVEAGSFDTFNQSATLSGSEDSFHFAATVDHDHAGNTPVTPLNLLLPGETRKGDYYDGVSASTKLGLDLSDNLDLGLVARYRDSTARITGDAFSLVTFSSYPSPTQTRLNTQQYETRGTVHFKQDWLDSTLGLAYSSTALSDIDPDNGSFPASGNRLKLDWQGNAAIADGETLVVGAETARDAMHLPIKAGTTDNAVYGELQSALGEHFFNSASIRYDDNSRFGGHATWRLAPAFVMGDTRLKATYGTGFKAPSLEQLFQSFPAFGFFANPNLKPETSTGYDAGIEQKLGIVSGGATWFHNDIKNLIADNASFTSNINIGKAKTQGVETFLTLQAGALSLRADYTYTDATDQTAHQQLVRRPRNKASLTADWQVMPVLDLNATVLMVGPQIDGNRDFSISRLKVPSYTLVNLAANWRVTDNFSLYGRVENIFNTQYQSPDGFLRPGAGGFAGIKANF